MIKVLSSRLLLVTFLITALICPYSVAVAQTNDLQPLVAANTAFALDFYAQLKRSDGNLFFSPYSISTCLAMTSAGARGNTEKQLGQVLHFSGNQAQLHSLFSALQKQLNEVQKTNVIELALANALWLQTRHAFLPAFLRTARQDYEANLHETDFRRNAEPARQKINEWVGTKTEGKITSLIPMGAVDQTTRLVLANAIYFKGAWASPFKTNLTTSQPFHVSGDRRVVAPLMHQVGRVGYFSSRAFQAIQLPYTNGQLSMVILLPTPASILRETESVLTPQNLAQCLAEMKNQEVDIYLPKVKLEIGFELAFALAKMGMPDAFKSSANFSGMDGSRDLFISAIFHEAYININEAGAEAAAATGVVMKAEEVRRPAPMPVFRADHPFVFLIRDDRSGTILFLGRLNDPIPLE